VGGLGSWPQLLKGGVKPVPEGDEVVGLESALQMPQVLLHAYSQNKRGVLVRQIDELGDGSSLMVNLLLEKLLPCQVCSHACPQHPETDGPDVVEGE
jgi:hypothetical protein